MRLTALSRISQMTEEEILERLESLPEYKELPDGGKAVREYWQEFLNRPQAEVVIADDLTEDEKKQFIIKDNVSFGDWDYEELENWDSARLENWGVDTQIPDFGVRDSPFDANRGEDVNPDDYGDEFTLPDGEKSPFQRVAFIVADAEAELIKGAIETIKQTEDFKRMETYGNDNSNGNAIYLIVKQWAEQRK